MSKITYEITATVLDKELCSKFERFMMEDHIPAVVEAGNFISAIFSRDSSSRYRIRYEARDRKTLDEYLQTAAPALRRAAVNEFPRRVEYLREEWEIVATFGEI